LNPSADGQGAAISIRQWLDVGQRILVVVGLWTLTSLLFYRIQTALGSDNGYNDAPVLFAVFYAAASLLVVALYHKSYQNWAKREVPPSDSWPGFVMAAIVAVFAVFVLGLLPAIDWQSDQPVPGLLAATPWYFLPKSAEILFQQVLITTLIVGFYKAGLSLRLTALLIGRKRPA
jgi:hypothetical protein